MGYARRWTILLATIFLSTACVLQRPQAQPTPPPQAHGEAPPADAAEPFGPEFCRKHVGHQRCRPTATPGAATEPTAVPSELPTLTPVPVALTATAIPAATEVPSPAPTSAAPAEATPAPATAVPTTAPLTDAQRWSIPDYPEVRSDNAAANRTRGEPIPEADLPPLGDPLRPYARKVDGSFTGTTEQVLEWAAKKWFPEMDPDIFKAQAVKESSWHQNAVGDGGVSFGILQVKSTVWGHGDRVKQSTAFAADFAAAAIRAHYDGVLYTGDYADWNAFPIRPDVPDPARYRRAVNAWYFGDGASHNYGDWSYNRDGAASEYVGLVLGGKIDEPGAQLDGQSLAGYLNDKPWKRAGF